MLMAIGGFVNTYYNMNDESKSIFMSSRNGKINYALRMTVGKLFSWRTPKQWYERVDKAVKNEKETNYITSAMGRGHYFGEMNPTKVVLPLKKAEFEGLEVYIPNDIDAFLKNLYGDYMQVPPPEKREKHFAIEVKTLGEL
jgi:lipopolysaccharide cholinephosphotransferase